MEEMRVRRDSAARASVAFTIVLSVGFLACASDKLRLQWMEPATPPNFVIQETFGQLEETGGVFSVSGRTVLQLSPATATIQAPSTGVIEFAATLASFSKCLLLTPKLRKDGQSFSSLGAGLGEAKSLRLALCNLDMTGTILHDAIGKLFVARGLSAGDASAAATAFIDPANPAHSSFQRVDVKAPPDVSGADWSILGQAAGGRLEVVAFRWDDDGDGIIQPGELTLYNPLPYLASLVPAGAVKEQLPSLEAFELQSSPDPAFAAPTVQGFDVVTGAMPTPAPIGGFIRARMKLAVHTTADPSGPTVAPWEIGYEFRVGGTLRSAGIARANAFKPLDAGAVAGRLYHTSTSTPATNVLQLQLPVDPANTGAAATPANSTTTTTANALDLGGAPAGAATLTITLRSALAAAPSFTRAFSFASAGGVSTSLDVDGNGSVTDAVDGWDTYLPGFEGSLVTRIDETNVQNMKVFLTGAPAGSTVDFRLSGTTHWEGINGNVIATGFPNSAIDPDFVLNDGSSTASPNGIDFTDGSVVSKTADATGKAWVWLRCRDYAASTTVETRIDLGAWTSRLLPKNSDASPTDHLPDAWENLFGVDLTDLSDDDGDWGPGPVHQAEKGDGLSAFEEYRGFRILDPTTVVPTLIYRRTNQMEDATPGVPPGRTGGPLKKDAFIVDSGAEPFRNFGKRFNVHGLTWHKVSANDKGDVLATRTTESGRLNRNTNPALRVQDQFAVLISGEPLGANILGGAGAIEWNDTHRAKFDLGQILIKMSRFGIVPPDPKIADAKEAVLAHEIGHRLTLRHLVEAFTLGSPDVKLVGSAPSAGQKAVLCDGLSKIQVRLKIQRRTDLGHVGEGYTTEIVAYTGVSWTPSTDGAVTFSPALDRFIFTTDAELETTNFEIPAGNVTVVVPGAPVETSDVVFDFMSPTAALIANVKAGAKTAKILIWRGNTCVMDAKIVEQAPRFGLESVEPGRPTNNLFELIQLKSARLVVGGGTSGEHGAY
jgi:hypothetical protein